MPWKRGIHYTKNTLLINSFIVWPSRKGDKGGNEFRASYICLCHGLRQFIRQTPLPTNSQQQGTRTKQKETKSPKPVKCPLIHLLHAIQQDGSPSGSSSTSNGRYNWVRAGTWAAARTRNLGSGWNWTWGRVKLWCQFPCFSFSRLDPVGVGTAVLSCFCVVKEKMQTCWALKPAAPI